MWYLWVNKNIKKDDLPPTSPNDSAVFPTVLKDKAKDKPSFFTIDKHIQKYDYKIIYTIVWRYKNNYLPIVFKYKWKVAYLRFSKLKKDVYTHIQLIPTPPLLNLNGGYPLSLSPPLVVHLTYTIICDALVR